MRLGGDCVNYIGKRHATRLMNDAYGRGIVRGQVENTNLRAYHNTSRVTAAEAIMTRRTTRFSSVEYVNLIQRLTEHVLPDNASVIQKLIHAIVNLEKSHCAIQLYYTVSVLAYALMVHLQPCGIYQLTNS